MEAVECGAASLGTILGFHGRYVPLEELRVACGVSRDGVTAKNILRAARTYGLEANGFKRELDGLRTTSMPCVLFWNFNHFVVLEGIVDDVAWLNDPATGPRRVTLQDLDEAYTGVVLCMSPGPAFERAGAKLSLQRAMRERIRGAEGPLAYAMLAGLALVLPGLLVPAFSRLFVDQVLVQALNGWVGPLLLGMALTALLRGALVWLRAYVLLRLSTRLSSWNRVAFSGMSCDCRWSSSRSARPATSAPGWDSTMPWHNCSPVRWPPPPSIWCWWCSTRRSCCCTTGSWRSSPSRSSPQTWD